MPLERDERVVLGHRRFSRYHAGMGAKIRFCGAACGVTGSNYWLETDEGSLVVDCGVFQGGEGSDALNRAAFPYEAKQLDAAVLTHGHLDHVGRLPVMLRHGFAAPVYGHPATLAVARLVMGDTAKIALHQQAKPLYDDDAVAEVLSRERAIGYGQPQQVGPFTITLYDAGHILGSSSVRVAWKDAGRERAILFSGDLGVCGTPIIRDPHRDWREVDAVDYVVTESTYGDRTHPQRDAARKAFRDAIVHAVSDGGKVLIPAFAIGRTQEVLYELNHLVDAGELPGVPVVVDGPMGLDATALYARFKDCYDEEALRMIKGGDTPLEFADLYAARAGRASEMVRQIKGPAIIIAGSGMCSGGRILGHLKEYLDDPRTDVIFVGYQAMGTLGRQLQDGVKSVDIDGESVRVKAVITTISGLSAHADRDALAEWFGKIPLRPGGAVFVTHGEEKSSRNYAQHLKDRFGARAIVPKRGDTASLSLE
jgi:metallo-beta-lactamase family protein